MTDVPTEVKQPEDHKPADDDVTVKTAKTGQTYSVSKKTFVSACSGPSATRKSTTSAPCSR
jgi:FPC/CPF motif-containing protein YcgG